MAKKQWKIGEYCEGGILSVEIKGKNVVISCLDWNTKKPVRICNFLDYEINDMNNNLNDMTSSYYADKVLTWIKENIPKRAAGVNMW